MWAAARTLKQKSDLVAYLHGQVAIAYNVVMHIAREHHARTRARMRTRELVHAYAYAHARTRTRTRTCTQVDAHKAAAEMATPPLPPAASKAELKPGPPGSLADFAAKARVASPRRRVALHATLVPTL